MFGFSMGELLVICVVALVAVGPKKLPGMLHQLGIWLRKLRNLTSDMRSQTGIDELLRSEGLHGGLNELRGLLRGNHGPSYDPMPAPVSSPAPMITSNAGTDPYAHIHVDADTSREYPPEGADAYGALPDDLIEDAAVPAPATTEAAASTNETSDAAAVTASAASTSETTEPA